MSSSGFLQTLMNFPKDTINEEAVELLSPYLEMPDYNMETAKKVWLDIDSQVNCTQQKKGRILIHLNTRNSKYEKESIKDRTSETQGPVLQSSIIVNPELTV